MHTQAACRPILKRRRANSALITAIKIIDTLSWLCFVKWQIISFQFVPNCPFHAVNNFKALANNGVTRVSLKCARAQNRSYLNYISKSTSALVDWWNQINLLLIEMIEMICRSNGVNLQHVGGEFKKLKG
jgi:hypothetical protein